MEMMNQKVNFDQDEINRIKLSIYERVVTTALDDKSLIALDNVFSNLDKLLDSGISIDLTMDGRKYSSSVTHIELDQ